MALQPVCQILTPVGMLGYGFDFELNRAAARRLAAQPLPWAIILDSGSTDGGPEKLALGQMSLHRSNYQRDLDKLTALCLEFHVPLLISSAGGDGTNKHVDEIYELCDQKLKIIRIYSDVKKSTVLDRIDRVQPCGSAPAITPKDVEDAPTIACQMGPEPFLAAMNAVPDFDVIIGGRAYDPSPYVAWCLFCAGTNVKDADRGMLGVFTHMGKVLECGAVCATVKSQSVLATVYKSAFDVTPLEAKCTPESVAAHTLYEKSVPDLLPGPGGVLDVTRVTFAQLDDEKSVRASGASFIHHSDTNQPYRVKLEGARSLGYRCLMMGGMRDPILVHQLDDLLARVKQYVKEQVPPTWELDFHVFGRNGIMKSLEPGFTPHEIFLVGEALAPTPEVAASVATVAKLAVTHGPYKGQKATGGNFAFGIGGKSTFETGLCAEFCLCHLMDLEAGEETSLFRFVHSGDSHRSPSASGIFHPPRALAVSDTTSPIQDPRTLADIANVVRSKTSGPFEITLDVIFARKDVFDLVKASGLLTRATIAEVYHLDEAEIVWLGFFEPAKAFKATVPRKRNGVPMAAGSFMESDVHGSQQHVGLLELPLPADLIAKLSRL